MCRAITYSPGTPEIQPKIIELCGACNGIDNENLVRAIRDKENTTVEGVDSVHPHHMREVCGGGRPGQPELLRLAVAVGVFVSITRTLVEMLGAR